MLMTAAENEELAMGEGMDAGADDYILKSSSMAVFRARIRAQLRRKQFEDENREIRDRLAHKALEAASARAASGPA